MITDRYEFLKKIGQGGNSEVFLVRDHKLDTFWAVKKISKGSDINSFESMKVETSLLATLQHPNIPRIVDYFDQDDYFYVVMDFVDGKTLFQILQDETIISESVLVLWLKQLCDTLHYLHTSQPLPIIFRDMKPENVLFTNQHVQLIDFGIAMQRDVSKPYKGPYLGTVGFASPEQYHSGILDQRSDIYSLGATFFYLSTGVKYAEGLSFCNLRTDISEGFQLIIEKCLRHDVEARYDSCIALRKDIEQLDKLNFSYESKIKKQALPFLISIVLTIMMLSICVYLQIQWSRDNKRLYEQAMQNQNYLEAMNYHQSKADPYIRYYENCKLSKETMEEGIAFAIQRMEDVNVFAEDLINSDQFFINIAIDCIKMNEKVYYRKATYIFERIDDIENWDIESFIMLTKLLGSNYHTEKDLSNIATMLMELEKKVDLIANPIEKIQQYEMLAMMYFSKKTEMKLNAYEPIVKLMQKQDALLQEYSLENVNYDEKKYNEFLVRMVDSINDCAKEYLFQNKMEQAEASLHHMITICEGRNDISFKEKEANAFWQLYMMDNTQTYLIKAYELYTSLVSKTDNTNIHKNFNAIQEELKKF